MGIYSRTIKVRDYNTEVLTTPKVKEAVRAHFNCPTLEGAELENQGSSPTEVASHLERRVFGNEVKISNIKWNPLFF